MCIYIYIKILLIITYTIYSPYRGAGTISYVGGPTNQNKLCCKRRGDQYIGVPLDFKVGGGHIPPVPPPVVTPLILY